jgi:hypothetical protein
MGGHHKVHLPCENCAMLGRIGEVGLTAQFLRFLPVIFEHAE